ncbi:probable LRR receptor-like protein kinase At1g51890 [Morus notabilis]|nr:probable LRR receptor-like protein kinase At1g51890 [Morus notabilis]
MELKLYVFFALFLVDIALTSGGVLNQTGYISIDCGLQPNMSTHVEGSTDLKYVSDEAFIDTGVRKVVSKGNWQQQYMSLRSFPEGDRNCYKIGVTTGTKYLIRASFFYGNYDGEGMPPTFDLYLGASLWDSVKTSSSSDFTIDPEIIHVPQKNHIHICLVKTSHGIPFISAIELRPLDNSTYQAQTGSLALLDRLDTGVSTWTRYYGEDMDVYDRLWSAQKYDDWKELSTNLPIDSEDQSDHYSIPSLIMSTAFTPKNEEAPLEFPWTATDEFSNGTYYFYMHFAEIEQLQANESREFNIFYNGDLLFGPVSPKHLQRTTLHAETPFSGFYHNFSIRKTEASTHPPIINAFEIYTVKEFSESESDQQDVDAITTLKSTYGLRRNWQGDPCAPKKYLWEGLNCSYENTTPRIISLNLENNNLNGQLPDELIEKRDKGLLTLSVGGNPNLCASVSCKKKNFLVPVVASLVGTFVLLLAVAAIWWGLKRKRQHGSSKAKSTFGQYSSEYSTKRQFTYSDILRITNNFERIIGKGGFGTVYHGQIGDTQVAVKMLSPSSFQGYKQFQAEVSVLLKVHHKNLTTFVGYFTDDQNNAGLVYEYMNSGDLQSHLSDNSSTNILKWEDRLHIAMDAAQGLEYLHHGCKPPIIHRDVKPANILLNENFQAKLSDFGISKTFPTGFEKTSHVLTVVAGTPGYIDPEYYKSNRLNEKSDVYSFGMVLLEIITGKPAMSKAHDNICLGEWVTLMLEEGRINSIVDPRLQGNFSVNTAWKVVEIAINCVSPSSAQRPTMGQVVGDLKECLEISKVANAQENGLRDSYEMSQLDLISADMTQPLAR